MGQIPSNSQDSHSSPLRIPTKLMDGEDLRRQERELRRLCSEFDPFSGPDEELRQTLERYVASPDTQDPFRLTNELISLLEDTLEELRSREE